MGTSGNGSQIFRVAYLKTSDLATALGYAINEGDNITEAEILGVSGSLTWQQLQVNNDISALKRSVDPLTQMQYGAYYKDDYSQKGFEKPEGAVEYLHNTSFSTTHSAILENGLGTKTAGSVSTTVDGAVSNSTTVDVDSAAGLVAGDFIEIGDYIARIESVVTNTLTLNIAITAADGAAVTEKTTWNPQTLSDDDSFVIFVEASKGSYFVTHARWGVDLDVAQGDYLKLKLNFQGDKAVRTTATFSTIGTVTAETIATTSTTGHFSGVYLNSAAGESACVHTFNPKLTREMQRKQCAGTQSRQGNGGTFRDKFTTELSVVDYTDSLNTVYEANTQFEVFATRPGSAIYAPKSLVRMEDGNTVTDNQNTTTYTIALNTDMSSDMIIIL